MPTVLAEFLNAVSVTIRRAGSAWTCCCLTGDNYVLGMPKKLSLKLRRIRIRCVQTYCLEFFHDVITFFGDEIETADTLHYVSYGDP